jgi:hypothetical protein
VVRPSDGKAELELATSICTMSYNVMLQGCTRHTAAVSRKPCLKVVAAPPYRAMDGNRATVTHHGEVGVSADGLTSTPPSGAAAAAPPTGAFYCIIAHIAVFG